MKSIVGQTAALHIAYWRYDPWYRRAWFVFPQAAALLLVGWLLADHGVIPVGDWAKPVDCSNASTPGCATPNPAAQQGSSTGIAQTVHGTVQFAGRAIPLPTLAGSSSGWTVVARIPIARQDGLRIDNVVLAAWSGHTLTGLVRLTGSDRATPSKTGYRADGNCERSDVNFTAVQSNADFGEQECQMIDFVEVKTIEAQTSPPVMRAAIGDIKLRSLTPPSTMVGAYFRLASREHVLIATYYFNPEIEGIPAPQNPTWSESDWNKYKIANDPAKRAYIARVQSWIGDWKSVLKSGFDGQLAMGQLPPPYRDRKP
jgi:hypothetical protein